MLPALITVAVIWFSLGLLAAQRLGRITDDIPLDAPLWHPHTEQPDDLTTAVIAIEDKEGENDPMPHRLLPGIYYLNRDGRWQHEESGTELAHPVFWWAAEDDLVAMLPER